MDTVTQKLSDAVFFLLKAGTVVDATLIAAPSSTKNSTSRRDSEMDSTKNGKNYHFGMKTHIGVDASSGLAHTETFAKLSTRANCGVVRYSEARLSH